jgi:choline dehydrogenase
MKSVARNSSFDYIIVGSGAAGCVLADRLSRDPSVSVLVLEAGGSDRSVIHLVPKGVRFTMSNPKYTKTYVTEPYGEGKVDTWYRGRVIGGSTTINGQVWNRGWAPQYDAWQQAGVQGWSWERFLEAFKAIEDHELGASATRGSKGPVSISIAKPREPVCDAFINALAHHGIGYVEDLNSSGDQRVGYVTSNIKKGTRVSAARAFLRNARRRRNNLTVLERTEAERIIFEGNRAVGVQASRNGEPLTVLARREVLVCGGALESPLLLERSGVGHPDVLAAAGVPLVVASPRVGENMREHRLIAFRSSLKGRVGFNAQVNSVARQGWTGLKYLFTRKGVISFGSYNIVALFKSDPASPFPDTQGFFMPLSVSGVKSGRPVVEKNSGAMFLTYPLYPTSTGSVHISGPSCSDKPRVVPNYLATAYDQDITVKMVHKTREILSTEPFAEFVDTLAQPPTDLTDNAKIVDYVVNQGGLVSHTVGTCAIGANEDDVVDERLRVRGTTNLRVVDASIFPEMPSGNNNSPTQAMAWIAADLILKDAAA